MGDGRISQAKFVSGNVGSRVESLAITKLCLENLAILRQICEEALTAKFRKW